MSLKLDQEKFYFAPLGGSEQFGVNCNIYMHEDAWLMVDLGMGFAEDNLPGIDLILPDISYVVENRDKLSALIITHAHEDHVGAVAYLWPRLRCPIYCTPFTAEVLREKFKEHKECQDAVIHEIRGGDHIETGPFHIDFVHMAHSIPETVSLFIQTQAGTAFHSADWNLDPTPVIGKPTDKSSLEKIAKQGVHAYIGDSTNALYAGRAGSEKEVEEGLLNVIGRCEGKIVITLFASNIARIQSISRAARDCGRKVCVVGYSLHKMIAAARNCGYLSDIPDFLDENDMPDTPDENLLVIATGSQGESRAAMARISRGDWQGLTLGRDDTVIFSSREIPGNEKDIERIKNNCVTSGAAVISPDNTNEKIHVSGHPYRDEVYEMLQLLKPRSVIPVHGEHIQISGQAEIARGCGVDDVQIPVNGMVVEISEKGLDIAGYIDTNLLAVEPKRIIPVDHKAIRERRKIQYCGVIHVTIVLDDHGDMLAQPQISSLGLVDDEYDFDLDFTDQLKNEINSIHTELTDDDLQESELVREQFRIGARRFANHIYGLKPVVNVHLVRVR